MTRPREDEETWDEEPYRRVSKPLTVQLAVRPAGSRAGLEAREGPVLRLAFRLQGPPPQPVPFA